MSKSNKTGVLVGLLNHLIGPGKQRGRHRQSQYIERLFPTAGGLVSYGPDFADQYRRAASYIDRILKGEKPADLPVQTPTKYELAVNLTTAKAWGWLLGEWRCAQSSW